MNLSMIAVFIVEIQKNEFTNINFVTFIKFKLVAWLKLVYNFILYVMLYRGPRSEYIMNIPEEHSEA